MSPERWPTQRKRARDARRAASTGRQPRRRCRAAPPTRSRRRRWPWRAGPRRTECGGGASARSAATKSRSTSRTVGTAGAHRERLDGTFRSAERRGPQHVIADQRAALAASSRCGRCGAPACASTTPSPAPRRRRARPSRRSCPRCAACGPPASGRSPRSASRPLSTRIRSKACTPVCSDDAAAGRPDRRASPSGDGSKRCVKVSECTGPMAARAASMRADDGVVAQRLRHHDAASDARAAPRSMRRAGRQARRRRLLEQQRHARARRRQRTMSRCSVGGTTAITASTPPARDQLAIVGERPRTERRGRRRSRVAGSRRAIAASSRSGSSRRCGAHSAPVLAEADQADALGSRAPPCESSLAQPPRGLPQRVHSPPLC